MSIASIVEENRHAIDEELAGTDANWYFSAVTYSLYKAIHPVIKQYAKGKLLDAGAGHLQFKPLLMMHASHYDSLDVERRHGDVDRLGDIQDMASIGSETYDTVFCNQVLEHVPSPWKALREIHRILKPHGVLILSAPHLSRLHEEPSDYYRYTQHGFRHLLSQAGFADIRTTTAGGLLSFLFHQVSTVILGVVWGIPLVKRVCFFLNKVLLVKGIVWLDERTGTREKFPVNNIAIAFK